MLHVNLTGLQGAQTFGQTLFWVCLRLKFELIDREEQIALPSVCGPHPAR